jgi:hypothetical protein
MLDVALRSGVAIAVAVASLALAPAEGTVTAFAEGTVTALVDVEGGDFDSPSIALGDLSSGASITSALLAGDSARVRGSVGTGTSLDFQG